MPILDVRIVGSERDFPDDLSQRMADAAGNALGSRQRGTWVHITFIPGRHYAESQGQDAGVAPVIVSLLQYEIPPAEQLRLQIGKLTDAVSTASGVPRENVHIIVEPAARGRMAFGGNLV